VTSTLLSVELPEGEAVVPNIAAVRRAEQEDLKKPMQYQVGGYEVDLAHRTCTTVTVVTISNSWQQYD
jgi:hypothetical protein